MHFYALSIYGCSLLPRRVQVSCCFLIIGNYLSDQAVGAVCLCHFVVHYSLRRSMLCSRVLFKKFAIETTIAISTDRKRGA